MEDMRKMVDELVFGDRVSRPMDISATRLNNNVVVVGSTGAGKTTAYTEANLLSFSECSVVVSMSKRVLADRYAEEYERRGYEVAVVDLAEPSASQWGYDPLAMVRNAEDVSDLAREVVQANAEHEQDPYWSNSAAVLLEALLLASLEMRRVDASLPPASISDAIDLFEELSFRDGRGGVSESTLDHLFEALEMKDPCSEAAAKWRSVKADVQEGAGLQDGELRVLDAVGGALEDVHEVGKGRVRVGEAVRPVVARCKEDRTFHNNLPGEPRRALVLPAHVRGNIQEPVRARGGVPRLRGPSSGPRNLR